MNDLFVTRTRKIKNEGKRVSEKWSNKGFRKSRRKKKWQHRKTSCTGPRSNRESGRIWTEGSNTRQLASASTPVEQGHDFATLTGALDREEISEGSDILIEKLAVEEVGERSHLFLLLGITEDYYENFHSNHDGAVIGEETVTHEENDKNKEENYYKTQVSFKKLDPKTTYARQHTEWLLRSPW